MKNALQLFHKLRQKLNAVFVKFTNALKIRNTMKEEKKSFILNQEHLEMFLSGIRDEILEHKEEALKLEFNPSEYYAFEKIIKLIHDNSPENKNNFIKKAYQNVQIKVSKNNRKDIDQIGKTSFEKSIMTATKNQYKKVQMGIMESKQYNNKTILMKSYIGIKVAKKDNDVSYAVAHNFRKKYRPIVKEAMSKLRLKYHNFKNTIYAQEFKQRMNSGVFMNKIDYERLYKYVSSFDMQSTKETFEFLKGVIHILCLKHNQDNVPEHYKKSLGLIGKEFVPVEDTGIKDKEIQANIKELMEDLEVTPEEFEQLRKDLLNEF